MKRRFNVRSVVWVAFAAVALLSLTAGAGAVQGDKKFRLLDDCDPVTFANVPGGCIGNGKTTMEEFEAELAATGEVHKWRNQPEQAHLNVGRPTEIENRGGEVHTFTPVAQFGGGFVPPLNILSGNPDPAPECLNIPGLQFIPAGAVVDGPTAGSSEMPVGVTRFQCCIHPWMRTVVEVADPGGHGGGGAPASPAKGNSASHHDHH